MSDLCSIIYLRISSKDILNLIVSFRTELYLQEMIEECGILCTNYAQLYEETNLLYHYYDCFIYRHFRFILESESDNQIQLLDLMNTFRMLNGNVQSRFKQLQNSYIESKEKVDLILDSNLLIFYAETLSRIREENSTMSSRKNLKSSIVVIVRTMLEMETQALIDSAIYIKNHCRTRLQILQYIVNWVFTHTVKSWSFWFKSFIQKPSDIYYSLRSRQSSVEQFLKCVLD